MCDGGVDSVIEDIVVSEGWRVDVHPVEGRVVSQNVSFVPLTNNQVHLGLKRWGTHSVMH